MHFLKVVVFIFFDALQRLLYYMIGNSEYCYCSSYLLMKFKMKYLTNEHFKMCAYCFVLNRWLLTPFKNNGHLTAGQLHYNEKHAGTRQVIERAFGLLKGRWRRLKCLEMEDIEEMSHVATAACVLHNFCLFADQGDIEQFLDEDGDDGDNSESDQPDQPMPQAIAKRNLMVQYLNNI